MDLSISRPELESPVLHLASFLSVVDDICHGHRTIWIADELEVNTYHYI